MKKYFKFFFMAAAMFVSVMFASCSKDDVLSQSESPLPSVKTRSDVQSRSFVETKLVAAHAELIGSIIFHSHLPPVLLKKGGCMQLWYTVLEPLSLFQMDIQLNGVRKSHPAHPLCQVKIVL